ncbi:MAG: helix-turn-helix domain-containing protein [Myxococcota bacterium]
MAKPKRLVQTRPTGQGRVRGLVSGRTSGMRVNARTYVPSEDLADVVASFWVGEWDLRGQPSHTTELLGDPCVHFVFERGDSDQIGARVVGVWTRLWSRTLAGRGRVRGVKLRAGAVRAFVERSAHTLSNTILPISDVLPSEEDGIEAATMEPEDDSVGLACFEEWLRQQRRDDSQVSLAVALVDRIASDGEIITVEALSKVAGLGVRALQRLFRDYVGASPKWVIRRNRLQEVALRLERGETTSLAALAADLGYTDQAHLARDFKTVVGKSPSAFANTVND